MTAEIIKFGGRARPLPAGSETEPAERPRCRGDVITDIERHIAARDAYGKAVAWEAAAESQGLPAAQIEAARERTAQAFAEMQDRAHSLLVVFPTDPRALVDLLLYLEKNWTVMPADINTRATGSDPQGQSVAFNLLRTMRLSLRAIAKYGKYDGCRDDK